MSLAYVSICSGIEAATAAWHSLGWNPLAFAEIEPFPSAVLKHHHPTVPNLGDMTRFHEWPELTPDVLVGGTPCQAFSVAGLRKGLADPRGNLTLVFLGLVARMRPRWVVWENVPGVLSDQTGAFGALLGGLGELGYGFAYRVLDAQYVRVDSHPWAVPQRRRRVFVVGHLGDWRRAAAVLFERESLSGNPPPRREAGQRIARGFECGPQGCRFTSLAPTMDARAKDGPIRNQLGVGVCEINESAATGQLVPSHDPACTLTARERKGPLPEADLSTVIAHSLRADGFDASEDGTGRGTPLVPVAFAQNTRDEVRIIGGDVAGALPAQPGMKQQTYLHIPASAVRRLTPRECERLQGFPDDYTAIPWRGKPACECPDGPRYKALGNSMAVNVMRWIGQRIELVESHS